MDTLRELEKELERLKIKWGRGKELKVQWMPCVKKNAMPYDKDVELRGEVDKVNRCLMVYDSELEDCLHVLRHEFFEYMIDCELVSPYVTLYNQMQRAFEKAFMETAYPRKEAVIEILVENEEKSLKEGEKYGQKNDGIGKGNQKHTSRR